ncbi:Choline binding protein A [Streptococcus mitis]|uniref:Choline binding protein A n=1 Tax=Streptococcus mitis TaxID=28037 RepID=A0A150NND8_STRMT|nr:Choline binding protein A [Streptococcus mitis]
MRKTLTGILLATSVLAMATVQQVQAAEAGSTSASATSNIKAVRFVEFKNGILLT